MRRLLLGTAFGVAVTTLAVTSFGEEVTPEASTAFATQTAQIVVINRGSREGVDIGSVFEIYQAGELIVDQVSKERNASVKLPDEKAGLMMVFRTFDKVSFGLIMKASRALHVGDHVRNP